MKLIRRSNVLRMLKTEELLAPKFENIPGKPDYWHRLWLESLACFDPLTYEFEESEASRQVKTEAALYLQGCKEWSAECRATGRWPDPDEEQLWRLFQERLRASGIQSQHLGMPFPGAQAEGKLLELGTETHRQIGDSLSGEEKKKGEGADEEAVLKFERPQHRADDPAQPPPSVA